MANKTQAPQAPATLSGIARATDPGTGEVSWIGADGRPVPAHVAVMLSAIAVRIEAESTDGGLSIADAILSADSLDAIAGMSQDTVKVADLVGHVLTVRSVKWQEGDYAEGLGVYAVAFVHDETSATDRVLTTGATNVVAFLFKCEVSGWLPVKVQVRSNRTAAGFDAYWLVPAPTSF